MSKSVVKTNIYPIYPPHYIIKYHNFQQSIFFKNSIHITFYENKQSCHVTWSTPRNSRPSLYPSLPSRNRFTGRGACELMKKDNGQCQSVVTNILNYFPCPSPRPSSSARFLRISLYPPTTLHHRWTR